MGEHEREGGRRREPSGAKHIVVQMLCHCPECGGINKFVIDWNYPRNYSKCQVCGQHIPTGGYKVIAHTNDLNHPIF